MITDRIISGADAINRMRRMRGLSTPVSFGVQFITYDQRREEVSFQTAKYERCSLRTARRSEGLQTHSDHYLYFTDLDTLKPLQCWRRLLRYVRFGDVWFRVKWYDI